MHCPVFGSELPPSPKPAAPNGARSRHLARGQLRDPKPRGHNLQMSQERMFASPLTPHSRQITIPTEPHRFPPFDRSLFIQI
jgi:hypothetical protein